MNMDVKSCTEFVDNLIIKADKLVARQGTYEKRIDDLRDLHVQLPQLMRTLFPDADARIKDYRKSMHVATERDKEGSSEHVERAKVIRRYLDSVKGSLKLRETVEAQEVKLDKLESEVREKEVEAKRRKAVAETKVYGAEIELIDRLRAELKSYKSLSDELITIKGDIKEIKEMLGSLLLATLGT